MNGLLPCRLFEDEHLLAVNKPAGLNTHAPSPYAGEGLYDWLRHRDPAWARLALVHRLDKETSGVLVLAKTPLACRSLTEQFTRHTIRKTYRFLTDRAVSEPAFEVESTLVRLGEKYLSRPAHAGGQRAITRFRVLEREAGRTWLEAEPVTGRTHQIRVHAADRGLPILGDVRYGGSPAARVYLHAGELVLHHPASGAEMTFTAPLDFATAPNWALRMALLAPETTTAWRLVQGAADGWPGWAVDRLGDWLWSQGPGPLPPHQRAQLEAWLRQGSARGAYHKLLRRQPSANAQADSSPVWVAGELAPEELVVVENGIRFALRLDEGYSMGLFLDQRENRRRLLANHIGAGFPLFAPSPAGAEVLNAFAYTCGFSVCAARAGARVTSLDLSKKYLDWGRHNLALNGLDPNAHEFLHGDVFDWARRLARKSRRFDLIILDPPTFSRSKASGSFQAETDYGKLVRVMLPLLKPRGLMLAATNAARLTPETFLATLDAVLADAGRPWVQRQYVPQPPDFPVSRDAPAYLKTVWLRL